MTVPSPNPAAKRSWAIVWPALPETFEAPRQHGLLPALRRLRAQVGRALACTAVPETARRQGREPAGLPKTPPDSAFEPADAKLLGFYRALERERLRMLLADTDLCRQLGVPLVGPAPEPTGSAASPGLRGSSAQLARPSPSVDRPGAPGLPGPPAGQAASGPPLGPAEQPPQARIGLEAGQSAGPRTTRRVIPHGPGAADARLRAPLRPGQCPLGLSAHTDLVRGRTQEWWS